MGRAPTLEPLPSYATHMPCFPWGCASTQRTRATDQSHLINRPHHTDGLTMECMAIKQGIIHRIGLLLSVKLNLEGNRSLKVIEMMESETELLMDTYT